MLRIFISEIEKQLKKCCDGITDYSKLGAVSFIQRFGSRLNLHIHFHCVVFDGVFYTDQKGILQFAEVYYLGKEDTDHVEARVRQQVLSLFKRRRLLTEDEVENIKGWKGSGGLSVNADVHIEENDRRGAERLIRYSARPAFSREKLKLIAFIRDAINITKILTHFNEEVEAPKMQSARAPPDDYQIELEQEFVFDPEPDYQFDQTVSW